MAVVHLSDADVTDGVLVVGLSYKAGKKSTLVIESGDLLLDTKSLLGFLSDVGANGQPDEVIKFPGTSVRLLVFTGLGKNLRKYDPEVLRRAAGAASQKLAGNPRVTFSLPASDVESVNAVAEGAALGAYNFTQFRETTKGDFQKPIETITIRTNLVRQKDAKAISLRANIIAKYTSLVRDLVNTPPSHLNPISFVDRFRKEVAQAGGTSAGLKVSVLTQKELLGQGFGGIMAVGQDMPRRPREPR